MNPGRPSRRIGTPSEEGYILVAVIFMLAILMISMTIAAPKIKQSIQRERELETMHRGKQYARGVKMYYKKFGTYPPNVDAMVKTNDIRFLRRKYVDPTTGKEDWKIVRYGQQKTQTLGFFGQPIGGPGMTGAGIAGSTGFNGPGGVSGGGIGSGNGFGSNANTSFGSGTGGSMAATTAPGATDTTGTAGTSADGQSGAGNTGNGTDSSGNTNAGNTTSGNGASGIGSSGNGSAGSTSAFGTPGGGQTMGGMGIMGFSPNSPKQSILVYKKKNHYNEWEFLYDPIAEQMMSQGGGNLGAIGTPIGGTGTGSAFGGGSGSSFGSFGSGNNGFGATGTGNNGTGSGNGGNSNPNGSGNGSGSTTNPPATPPQ
jgi:type II secretory pathway pseudopilin PulG